MSIGKGDVAVGCGMSTATDVLNNTVGDSTFALHM
jgi:hypothetical protein